MRSTVKCDVKQTPSEYVLCVQCTYCVLCVQCTQLKVKKCWEESFDKCKSCDTYLSWWPKNIHYTPYSISLLRTDRTSPCPPPRTLGSLRPLGTYEKGGYLRWTLKNAIFSLVLCYNYHLKTVLYLIFGFVTF